MTKHRSDFNGIELAAQYSEREANLSQSDIDRFYWEDVGHGWHKVSDDFYIDASVYVGVLAGVQTSPDEIVDTCEKHYAELGRLGLQIAPHKFGVKSYYSEQGKPTTIFTRREARGLNKSFYNLSVIQRSAESYGMSPLSSSEIEEQIVGPIGEYIAWVALENQDFMLNYTKIFSPSSYRISAEDRKICLEKMRPRDFIVAGKDEIYFAASSLPSATLCS